MLARDSAQWIAPEMVVWWSVTVRHRKDDPRGMNVLVFIRCAREDRTHDNKHFSIVLAVRARRPCLRNFHLEMFDATDEMIDRPIDSGCEPAMLRIRLSG
jgi:hypothetical protein